MRPPIVILGTGRCGSSLLQRLLNTHVEVAIWGEHYGFLAPLAEAYFNLMQGARIADMGPQPRHGSGELPAIAKLRRTGISQRWINPFAKSAVKDSFAQLLLELYGATPELRDLHWGFKEIRYGRGHRVLEFLEVVFPGFQLVFPARHPRDTVVSMMLAWPWTPPAGAEAWSATELRAGLKVSCDKRLRHWLDVTSYLLDFQSRTPQRVCLLCYEDLLRDSRNQILRVFDFLHVDLPPVDRIERVLAQRPGEPGNAQDLQPMQELVQKRMVLARSSLIEVAGALGYEI